MTEIVCTLTDDGARERFAEYARLFAAAYADRERTAASVRWFLRAGPGIVEWVRDLAAREAACCAFLTITVIEEGDRVLWDMTCADEPAGQQVLEVFYDLPLHGDRR